MSNISQEELISLFEKKFGKIISADGEVGRSLGLSYYNYPLPNSITSINGWLDLNGYNHPLPNSIISVGNLYLGGYNHPLPNSIVSAGDLFLRDYKHPLPNSIKRINGHIWVNNGYNGLPDNFHEWNIKKINYYI